MSRDLTIFWPPLPTTRVARVKCGSPQEEQCKEFGFEAGPLDAHGYVPYYAATLKSRRAVRRRIKQGVLVTLTPPRAVMEKA